MNKNYNFWFVVGSQFLYGPEVLETVEEGYTFEKLAKLKDNL